MISTKQYSAVSEKDIRIILSIVEQYPNQSAGFYIHKLSFVIDVLSIQHYMAIGHALGYSQGADQIAQEIQTSIQLCQRQN